MYALDCHLSLFCVWLSGIPAIYKWVAAPILKEWDLNVFVSTCKKFRHFCKMLENWNDVKGLALIWQKVGLIGLAYTASKS